MAMKIDFLEADECLCIPGFYNTGLQQSMLDTDKKATAEKRLRAFCKEIAAAFHNHNLDGLAMCELGTHLRGLEGRKNFGCRNQLELMTLVIERINNPAGAPDEVGARELHLELL